MKAMILCAGLGTRLRPITDEIPKPLVPFFGEPAVSRVFRSLGAAGITESVVNLHHLPQKVVHSLGSENHGVAIAYSMEKEILGAVGGLRQALPHFENSPFLVANGDVIADIDVKGIIAGHKESGADMTMAVGKVRGRDDIHVVGVAKDGRVVSIRKEGTGEAPAGMFVNLGIFVYEPEIIEKYVPEGKPFGFVDGIVPLVFRDGCRIMAYEMSGYWNDIGAPADYLKAHRDALDGLVAMDGAEEAGKRAGAAWISESAEISDGAGIGAYTVVYAGAVVEAGAELSEIVVMPGARIPANASLSGGIFASTGFIPA